MPSRPPSPALLLAALLLACLAPVGLAATTGAGAPGAGRLEAAGQGGAGGDGDGLAGPGGAGGTTTTTAAATLARPGPTGAPATTARPPATTLPSSTAPPPTTVPPTTTPPTTAPPTTAPPSPTEQVITLVNQARADAGCGPVRSDDRLAAAAQAHSDDMAANDYFSHTSLDGRTFDERISDAGYPGGYVSENIAQGHRSAQQVHDAWMSSPGHRRNILDCAFTDIGMGLSTANWSWTQDFGAAT